MEEPTKNWLNLEKSLKTKGFTIIFKSKLYNGTTLTISDKAGTTVFECFGLSADKCKKQAIKHYNEAHE